MPKPAASRLTAWSGTTMAVLALGFVTCVASDGAYAQDSGDPVPCPPLRAPVAIDGDLSEWEAQPAAEIGEANLVKSDEPWAGPSDLSGRIWFARSATTLYFAGEILDDTLFWNDQVTWLGDGVELFFDFRPRSSPREAESATAYDEFCHQLLLYPLVSELSWKFQKFRGESEWSGLRVDGIELAGRELRDGKSGYTFELAIPMSNFPALTESGDGLAEGRTFGFDVALSDSDGLPRQKHYATLSGGENLSGDPSQFGLMRLGNDPPEPPSAEEVQLSPIEPVAFLAVLLGGLLFLWLGTSGAAQNDRLARALERLRSLPLRPKLGVAIVLGALVVLAGVIARTVEAVLDARDVGAKRELAARLTQIAREAGQNGLLEPHSPVHPAPLIGLLTGGTVRPAEKFEYTLIPPRVEEPRRTLDGIPFLHRAIPARSALATDFVVHPRISAGRATLIYSWEPDAAAEPALAVGDPVAEFRFVHQSGEVDTVGPLAFGRHVIAQDEPIDPANPETGGPSDTDATVAYLTPAPDAGQTATNAVQLSVALPEETAASPLVRLEVQQLSRAGTFVVHGVTLHPRDSLEPVLLPLGRVTTGGVPTSASPFPARHDGLQLGAGAPFSFVDCDLPRADRLWLVASLRKGYKPHKFGAPVALVEAVFDDGSVEGPFRLENGLNVDLESARGRVHDDGYQAELAFEWGEHLEQRHHFDIVPFDLERPGRRLHQLQFEFTGDQEVVRISSIIAGTRVESTAEPGLPSHLGSGADGFFLAPQHVQAFAGLDYTYFRGGSAVATTVAGDAGERLLARRLSADELAQFAGEPEGFHETRSVEGRTIHVLTLAAVGGRADEILEISWASEVEQQLTGAVTAVRLCLAALLVPTLVLVLADLVLRVPSLHVRLVAGFAAVVSIPVGLGFVAVPELIEAKIEGTEVQAVRQKARVVKTHLTSLRPMARRLAENAFRDEALQEALMRQGAEDFRAGVAAALRDIRRNIESATGSDPRVALELLQLGADEQPTRFPERTDVYPGGGASVADQIAYRYCRLGATGSLVNVDNEQNWKRTLVVELPVSRSTLQEAVATAGGDAHVMVYSQRGFPLASTLQLDGDRAPDELARKRGLVARVLAEQGAVVVPQLLAGERNSVAYDVLRVAGDQLVLVATAIPRGGADALLNRIGYVSILVFGAGLFLQFLLTGLVVTSAFRPVSAVLASVGGASAGGGGERGRDELAELSGAVAAIQSDRELYREELSRLHDAVGTLSGAHDPAEVVDRALAIVRKAARPWGLVLLAGRGERAEVLGGFRGEARIPLGPVPLTDGGPLHAAVTTGSEAHVHTAEDLAARLGPEELRLIGVAHSLAAYPLADAESHGGALVLLEPSRTETPPPPHHGEFIATLARHVGVALESARLVRLAVRDPQTDTYVASYFERRLKEEVDRAVSARSAIALLVIQAADVPSEANEQGRALRRLAEAVRTRIPDRAFAGRVATSTLAVAVPEADRDAADELAIELRRTLAEPGLAGLRARVGFAACPDDAGSYEFLKLEAGRALDGEGGEQPAQPVDVTDHETRLKADARRLGAVFESAKGVQILDTVERIAGSDLTILVEGETGSGKEVVADLIHRKSGRRGGPLIKVNCAALPDALLESELFGFEPGAFTGADRTKPGRFELADQGTLFLDEIGDMPLATQVKLLRVLEDRAVEHLGGTRPIPVDVRVIAATNRDLRGAIAAGQFREDLFYRLNAVTISVPPLRARKDDIPALAEQFVRAAAETHGRKPPALAPEAMDALFRHDWPGNVRELRNALEQAVVLASGETIRASDMAPALRGRRQPPRPFEAGAADPFRRTTAGFTTPPGISDRQRRLLALLTEREWITNGEYCAIVGVSTRTGLRDLQDLIKRGVLDMEGKRRGARYRRR